MKTRVLLLIGIIGSIVARTGLATTLVRLSLEQLTQASTHIVRAHVISQESRWNPSRTRIVTQTAVAVAEALKGAPPSTLVIEQLGGTVGNIRLHVSGTVHFHSDIDYLLFLEPAAAAPSKFHVVGMMQGAYPIYRDATTRVERLIRPLAGLYGGPQAGGAALNAAGQTLPLSAFRRQVVDALNAPIVIPQGTSIPSIIESTEFRGVERLRVLARTTVDLFPSAKAVIPAGSPIEGTAQLVSGVWKIHWTELMVRGARVPISATSEEPREKTLVGKALLVQMR